MSSFENLRIVDNFYQTSLFFPMPTVVISTLCEDGTTNLGPYSLIQPYYVAGKEYYAMLLNCRNSSNTAQNILRTGKCAINFIDDNPKNFKEAVKLSWPGDKPSEKMPKCNFRLEKSLIQEENPDDIRPMVMTDAIEVIECTWMRELDGADKDQPGQLEGYEGPYHDFNGITSKFGAHFILRIDKILMKKKYSDAIRVEFYSQMEQQMLVLRLLQGQKLLQKLMKLQLHQKRALMISMLRSRREARLLLLWKVSGHLGLIMMSLASLLALILK